MASTMSAAALPRPTNAWASPMTVSAHVTPSGIRRSPRFHARAAGWARIHFDFSGVTSMTSSAGASRRSIEITALPTVPPSTTTGTP